MSSSCLCDQCSALCCRYFVLEIDTPQTRRQYDDIRWYLVHQNVFVFIEKRKWYLGVYSRCKHLQADNRCGIYETRPKICREYSTDNCDYHGGEYDWQVLFSSAEQLAAYAEEALAERALKRLKERRRQEREKARTPQLTLVKKPPRPAATRRRLPKLRPGLMLGPALAVGPNGNGNGHGNGQAHGNARRPASLRSLPVLPR
ncbi:MAG: Flagellin N-methylase [Phycisphaerales bacterium]|nr:Flagellin N-methylase [Phycisphaerales bacterium]